MLSVFARAMKGTRVSNEPNARVVGPHSTSVFLVRHAEAGMRTDRADDRLRPLSIAGRHQARSIAALFESSAIGDILSSPYTRCVQTMEPLADRRGCNVVHNDALAEGAPIEPLLRLLERVPAHSVLCTHGEVMRAVLDHAAIADTAQSDADRLAKGVVWELARRGDRVAVVEVFPPPAICPASAAG
jgi:8-oxo-dGTP diphosphatase